MNFHDLKMESIEGSSVPFSDYNDKPVLIVNVASHCGLTPQYKGLRALQEQGKVTVLGFPCNQFGAQEPGSPEEIQAFAKSKYDVNFPLFAKIEVNGDNACDLYKWLRDEQPNPDGTTEIQWNFTKFLVDGEGKVVKRFGPKTTPEEISSELDKYLD